MSVWITHWMYKRGDGERIRFPTKRCSLLLLHLCILFLLTRARAYIHTHAHSRAYMRSLTHVQIQTDTRARTCLALKIRTIQKESSFNRLNRYVYPTCVYSVSSERKRCSTWWFRWYPRGGSVADGGGKPRKYMPDTFPPPLPPFGGPAGQAPVQLWHWSYRTCAITIPCSYTDSTDNWINPDHVIARPRVSTNLMEQLSSANSAAIRF
jgi:hypothetical protein